MHRRLNGGSLCFSPFEYLIRSQCQALRQNMYGRSCGSLSFYLLDPACNKY